MRVGSVTIKRPGGKREPIRLGITPPALVRRMRGMGMGRGKEIGKNGTIGRSRTGSSGGKKRYKKKRKV